MEGELQLHLAMFADCAFVGETLTCFPRDVQVTFVRRVRRLWSGTFGVARRIYMTMADVYYVHYLLQGCHLAQRLILRSCDRIIENIGEYLNLLGVRAVIYRWSRRLLDGGNEVFS